MRSRLRCSRASRTAQEYADGIVSRQKLPRRLASSSLARLRATRPKRGALDLSRRITVERLGETRDYYIEGASIALRGFVRMEYLLSPVPGATVPSAPVVSVAQISGQDAQLAVSWSEPYSGGTPITDYDVRYKKSTVTDWTAWAHTGTGRTATITGLEPGNIAYNVQVKAHNIVGESAWSESGTGATPALLPSAPAAPTVAGNVHQLAVSWSEPYSGGTPITDYDVRYKKSTVADWTAWAHTGTARTATITGLLSMDTYDVQVRAQNSVGESAYSASGMGSSTPVHRLYAIRGNGGLWTVNPNTAAGNEVGSLGNTDWVGLAGLDGVLYAYRSNGALWTVNPNTASGNEVGSIGLSNFVGLAGLDGVLYAYRSNGALWTVNPNTASWKRSGQT